MSTPKQKTIPPCDGPDEVCHHSGMKPAECDYLCTSCKLSFKPCPDRAEIYRRAEQIRKDWPSCRIDRAEMREWEMEIPEATRVTDHMRRRAPHDQQ